MKDAQLLLRSSGILIGEVLFERRSQGWVFIVGSAIAVFGIGCFTALEGPDDMALLSLYVAFGGLIGPFVGGDLFDVTADYRASFALSALAIIGATRPRSRR